jgi:4-hydroxybenzoate polyprenyltransferase
MYYTYAYEGAAGDVRFDNPRTEWYRTHHRFILLSQLVLLCLCAGLFVWMVGRNYRAVLDLPVYYWLAVGIMGLAALSYYGLLPHSSFRLNLRNSGWAKAFVIGFVWACTVNILPLIVLRIENTVYHADPVLVLWLFVKNWMFCTVNAIMFDLKDYADDANHELKTFVVRFGLRKTIYFVLIPLLVIGILSLIAFTVIRHFPLVPVLFNLVPFLCLLVVAYSLHHRKPILFYLIVIDGLLLIKAFCGIAGAQFMYMHH